MENMETPKSSHQPLLDDDDTPRGRGRVTPTQLSSQTSGTTREALPQSSPSRSGSAILAVSRMEVDGSTDRVNIHHRHFEADDIDGLLERINLDRRQDERFGKTDRTANEAQSKITWGWLLPQLIRRIERQQLKWEWGTQPLAFEQYDQIQSLCSTSLQYSCNVHLPSYAKGVNENASQDGWANSAVPEEALEYCSRMQIDPNAPEAASVASEDTLSSSVDLEQASDVSPMPSALGAGGVPPQRPKGTHTDADAALLYLPLHEPCGALRQACSIKYKNKRGKSLKQCLSYLRITHSLDGTVWALGIHGYRSFRPFQYTGKDEISTWIRKEDECHFAGTIDGGVKNGVIKVTYDEALDLFKDNKIRMFAFSRYPSGEGYEQAKILIRFMVRLCCDLYTLRERQSKNETVASLSLEWPDAGLLELDPCVATRVLITGVTIEALIPRINKSKPGGPESQSLHMEPRLAPRPVWLDQWLLQVKETSQADPATTDGVHDVNV